VNARRTAIARRPGPGRAQHPRQVAGRRHPLDRAVAPPGGRPHLGPRLRHHRPRLAPRARCRARQSSAGERHEGSRRLTCALGGSGRRESNPHRELGKLPRTAPYGPMLQLGRHGHRPWLFVNDRCRPMVRARWGHGRDVTRSATLASTGFRGIPRRVPGPSERRIRRRSTLS
jgi:hypothetical protein